MQEKIESNGPVIPSFEELRPEDFDGHTDFAAMSPEQRLNWLSAAARFVHFARENRSAATNNEEAGIIE
ncbi:MAG: hypothetical protein JO333_08360 [Verrucomicrobia bacterium]|nr:hypothetical protein [Verrucomicrobiota bacterium]